MLRSLLSAARSKPHYHRVQAVSGDATDPATLIQAHIVDAAMLVIATPDIVGVSQVISTARTLNPGIEIVLRSHNEEETLRLRAGDGECATVFYGEEELARGMVTHVLQRFERPQAA